MNYPQVLALNASDIESNRLRATDFSHVLLRRGRQAATKIGEQAAWMFRRNEGIGWMLALALNVSAAGWLGVAIWTFIFSVSIVLETVAEPIQRGD